VDILILEHISHDLAQLLNNLGLTNTCMSLEDDRLVALQLL
jgi:hypothetical protein